VIGISLKYYAKSIFSILICVIIGFSPIFFWLSPALNHIYEYQKYANWSLLFFPCIVFSISSIFVVVFAIFSTKYMKINI
jgi:hypothetical protein